MPPLRLTPYREIAHEVAARLFASREGVSALAPWSEGVLVPSRGVAEAIVAELISRMPCGIAGLGIRTIDELAADVLSASGKTPHVASDAERRLAMRTAVRSVDDPMMDSRGIASMLERAYRDVRDSGITLGVLAQRVARARGLRNKRRTETILGVWRQYESLITQLGAIDPADRLGTAAEIISSQPPATLWIIAGFYDMTGAQLGLAQALLGAGRVPAIWVPTEADFAQPFVEAMREGAEIVRDPVAAVPEPRVEAVQYDTKHDELQDVCARVAALLADGTPAAEIGIVARSLDPYEVRLLNRFAEANGFATTASDSVPLGAHRIGRGVLTLLRLRERGFPRADVLEVVRDGLRTRVRIDVDEADAATRRARIAGGTSEELSAIRRRSRGVDQYIALVAELEQLTATIDTAFLSRLTELFPAGTENDLAAAEKIDEIASLFARAATWKRGFELPSVIDAIDQESIPQRADAGAHRVWAGEVLRFRGRTFRHLFAIRMQDDVFPQRRTEDPLLPDTDRRVLGLREIGDGADEERLLFALVSEGASHLTFSFATGDGFGKVLRKSRFLRALSSRVEHPVPGNVAHTAGSLERPLQLLVRAGTRSAFDGYVGPGRVQLGALSPTQLEDFGECPQKFLIKHVLGASDVDQPERELQIHPREKGTADHAILERFYRDLQDGDIERAAAALPALPFDLTSRLDAIVEEEFDRLAQELPPFNHTIREIEQRATKRILREFLTRDLEDLAGQGLVPRWFEYRFGSKHREEADHPEPFVLEAAGVPVRVEGTIDRIDQGAERFRIVDYKSGKAGRHQNLADKIDRGVRLQLALYAMAAAEFFAVDPRNVTATIKPIVAGDARPEKFAFSLHEKRETLLQTLEIFIRAMLDGTFPAFPNESDELDSCKYCPVNHSCRTRHDSDESRAVRKFRDPRTLLGGES